MALTAAIYGYQNKDYLIREALTSQGWDLVPWGQPADLALIERDMHYVFEHADKYGKIVLYPHGGNPEAVCLWDGPYEPYPVDLLLVHGPGHAEVLRRYGYPHPVEVVGWCYSEQRPFKPCEDPQVVLFCPKHDVDPQSHPEDAAINAAASQIVHREFGHKVHTRLGPLDNLNSIAAIDAADLVVADGTTLALAVARGKPAVSIEQHGLPTDDFQSRKPLAHAELYAAFVEYPYLIGDVQRWEIPLNFEQQLWRHNFVGEEFDAHWFSNRMIDLVC